MGAKHYFFDLDNTIAERNGIIPIEVVQKLRTLPSVTIVSGAQESKIRSQLNGFEPNFILAQNGNHALIRDRSDYTQIWLHRMKNKEDVFSHIGKLMFHFGGGEVQVRGSQISYSVKGHNADANIKRAFDPLFSKRIQALKKYPFKSTLFEVSVAGTTCFDYNEKGRNKGSSVRSLMARNNWIPEDCLYFGDALHFGGNDHSVVSVCPTEKVRNPQDTLAKL